MANVICPKAQISSITVTIAMMTAVKSPTPLPTPRVSLVPTLVAQSV